MNRVKVTQDELLADLTELCQKLESRPHFKNITSEQMKQLEILRENYRAGKIKLKIHQIYTVIKEQGYRIPKTTFYDWMGADV